MKLNVLITQDEKDHALQVVTFEPPVATWSFAEGHTLDELWRELHQATAALMHDHINDEFNEEMQGKCRKRILSVLLFWEAHKWVQIPASKVSPLSSNQL